VLCAGGGCVVDADLGAVEEEAREPRGGGPSPRSTFVVSPAEYQPASDEGELRLAAQSRWLFYLNRGGGNYRPGFDNSRNDRSSVLEDASAVPAWDVSDGDWQMYISCVRDLFSDYLVDITTENPGEVEHIEAVIGGSIDHLSTKQIPVEGDEPAGGISPFSSDCSTIKNSVVFIFSDEYGDDYQRICEVTAQEIAHSFGLDHEMLCEDPMSYNSGCRDKTFQDVEAPCGERAERSCAGPEYDCERDTQNSVEILSQRLGREDGTRAATPEVMGGCVAGGTRPGGAGMWLLVGCVAGLLRRRRRLAAG